MSHAQHVVDFEYPAAVREAIDLTRLALFDVSGVLRLECVGVAHSFYRLWWMRVFGQPALLFLLVLASFSFRMCERQLAKTSANKANQLTKAKSMLRTEAFFILFIVVSFRHATVALYWSIRHDA